MSLYQVQEERELVSPLLVVALEGWIDAGFGAAAAAAALLTAVETEVIASFDTEALLDYRARRPVLRVVDGVNTSLRWPDIELRAGHDADGNELLVLVGPEPDHQWKTFAAAVGELATSYNVRMMLGLGAFPAPVPHTRPARLASTATTEELARRVGFAPGTLDVPAGTQAVLEQTFAALGIPAVGLWARVPHYAAGMPYPEASVSLLEGLREIGGLQVDSADLRTAASTARERLDELVEHSDEHRGLVRQLEAQYDAETGDPLQVVSGEELAAEVERFLRGEGSS